MTGPTRLTRGGAIYGPASAFVIPAGKWPELATGHIGRSRKIVQPIEVYSTPAAGHLWTRHHPYAGVGSVALACRPTGSRTPETSDLYIPLRVVEGWTLLLCRIYFRVAVPRRAAPLAMPKMRILRVPYNAGASGQTVGAEPLRAANDGFDFLPLVTNADDWYAGGEAQSFDYVPDQNNVIDVTRYHYVVHLVEERGFRNGDDDFDGICLVERKPDCDYVVVNTTVESKMGAPISGDYDVSEGDDVVAGEFAGGIQRWLIVDSNDQLDLGTTTSDSSYNGIWLQGTPWYRAEDLDTIEDFTPYWIVRALGRRSGGGTWQCLYPGSSIRANFSASNLNTRTQVQIVPATPRGNIYHSLVPTFDVPDLRFQ